MESHKTGADVSGVHELAAFLERFPKLMVLSGAGMSTASGIPDYRDHNCIRRGKAPVQGPEFRKMEDIRRRYWARSMAGWPTLAKAIPNAGHHAIADLEAAGKISTVLTQNVDGLHQQAGSTNVIELHGNIHSVVCLECGTRFSRSFIQTLLEQANPDLVGVVGTTLPDGDAQLELDTLGQFHIPYCVQCDGMLQPNVVFFGDGVPRARTDAAQQALTRADALLVIGSSLTVLSGYRICRMAVEAGKPVAAINRGKTRADDLLSLKLQASSEYILPLLARSMRAVPANGS